MTREEKIQVVAELKQKLSDNNHFYITDTSGFTVAEINKFREMCYKEGIEYKVFKNTLVRKALEEEGTDYSSLFPVLKGFSGLMFVKENANAPAKLIKKYQKDDPEDRPYFKAASIDSDVFIGAEHLSTLSKLKSKQELIGEVITLLQSPAKTVVSALQSGGGNLAGILKTLSEKEQ